MPKWICPMRGCSIWVFAPAERPVHAKAPNPNFQAKDPHCPVHGVDLKYTPDDNYVPSFVPPSASKAKIGSIHDKLGVLVTRFKNHDVYCDYHQRKHVYKGRWPGQTPTDKPVYLPDIYDQEHLRLCTFLADSVPWENFRTAVGGVDIVFDCGQTVVGGAGETYILLQGGFQKEGATTVITFHTYPVDDDGPRKNTFRSCRENKRFFELKEVVNYLSEEGKEKGQKEGKGKKAKY